jgi:predicted house-cleaning noncanonical NTP pyrophosphatase (MazG superfamily)
MKRYNKLVRDGIPDILEKQGGEYFLKKIKNDREYFHYLRNKLVEEVSEFMADPSIEELADIHEVILTLAFELGHTQAELDDERLKKRRERGSFAERWILVEA